MVIFEWYLNFQKKTFFLEVDYSLIQISFKILQGHYSNLQNNT